MKIKRIVGASLTSAGMVLGMAGFAGAASGTIGTTGPDSYNRVSSNNSQRTRVHNDNDVSAHVSNSQWAGSGNAGVYHNTTGGSATSGAAANANSLSASVTLNNAASSAAGGAGGSAGGSNTGTINNTGPDSKNVVRANTSVNTTVSNDNDINVSSYNHQAAESGDATVAGNTTGGSATSGAATNTNSSTMNFNVSN